MNDIEKAMAAARRVSSLVPDPRFTESTDDIKAKDEYLSIDEHANSQERQSPSSDGTRAGTESWTINTSTEAIPQPVNGATASSQISEVVSEYEIQSEKKTTKYSKLHELPLASLDKLGFITPATPKNQITEEYRRIKRPLLKRLGRSNEGNSSSSNVLAVTSAMSGEGKTFSAINLAMSLAREKDRTVLLIDSDVVKHTAGALFGVKTNELGLLDLLDNDTIEPSDVILKTNVERLHFLPAGRKNAFASELLSSDTMKRLVEDLSSRYHERIVVMDCPPIMQTTEAAILVDHAGQIVFVVAEEQTSQGMVMQALRLIDDEKKVGVLLNKSTTRLGHYDYYNYSY